MAFTHALYYPWIDIDNIEDKSWFKTAILYWDKISTIVPEGYSYQSIDANFLSDAGVLYPEFVNPFQGVVQEASRNFLDYYSTEEASGILFPDGEKLFRIPSVDEAKNLASLNVSKMDDDLRLKLIRSGKVKQDGEWLLFDLETVNYYMTLLASSISRERHFAPVTEDHTFESLSSRVIRGDRPSLQSTSVGEGLLAKMTLESVGIAEETPYADIIEFRNANGDSLGRFREEISKLATEIDLQTPTIKSLQQQVEDIYLNKIAPAVNNLRVALQRSRIRNTVSHLTTAIFMASVPFLPKDTPVNLLTGAVSQIAAQGVNFALNRKDQLSQDPYSFVLKVEEHLG
jgi:hypothetical protein